MVGIGFTELGDGTESPRHSYGVDAGTARCLDVYGRVAYVHRLGFGCGVGEENGEVYARIRLCRTVFGLAHHRNERDVGKEMLDYLLCRRFVFVGGYGEGYVVVGELLEHLWDSRVRLGEVGAVLVVVFAEDFEQFVDFFRRSVWLGAFHQFPDSVAYHVGICGKRMLVVALGFEGMVAGGAEVGDGVEECSVKVEYYEFFHFFLVYWCGDDEEVVLVGRRGYDALRGLGLD